MITVDLSRNEFSAAVRKACLGAGADDGLAHDISAACETLEAAGVASLEHLLPLLQQAKHLPPTLPAQPYSHSQNGYFTPRAILLRNGSSVMDHLCLATVTVEACEDFVLLAAMVHAGCVARGRFARLISPGIPWSYLDHAFLAAMPGRLIGPVTFRLVPVEDHGELRIPPSHERVVVAIQHWSALQTAAAAVLVPPDETTRLRDAGAGLDDND